MPNNHNVNVGKICFSNDSEIKLILGPCQIESRIHALETCAEINEICSKLKLKFVYKSSFDKANRSSHSSSRGVGLKKGIEILDEVKEKFKCPIMTDVHEVDQCKMVSKVVDVIQIPAFLCRQTDLILAAGKTNCVVNVKKGQFLAPWDMKNIIEKLRSTGNEKIMLTERGTMFGYNNLVTDIRSLVIMKTFNYPVIFDATHSVQLPGSSGKTSGGQREFVENLAKAAVTTKISSIFIETHQNPSIAPSDGQTMISLKDLPKILHCIKLYDSLAKSEYLN